MLGICFVSETAITSTDVLHVEKKIQGKLPQMCSSTKAEECCHQKMKNKGQHGACLLISVLRLF